MSHFPDYLAYSYVNSSRKGKTYLISVLSLFTDVCIPHLEYVLCTFVSPVPHIKDSHVLSKENNSRVSSRGQRFHSAGSHQVREHLKTVTPHSQQGWSSVGWGKDRRACPGDSGQVKVFVFHCCETCSWRLSWFSYILLRIVWSRPGTPSNSTLKNCFCKPCRFFGQSRFTGWGI